MKALMGMTAIILLSGCSTMGSFCDESKLSLEYSHTSHPMAGRPFESQYGSEDTLDTLGPNLRCERDGVYIDSTLGYKIYRNGFEGPGLTGSLNVGVTLWEM